MKKKTIILLAAALLAALNANAQMLVPEDTPDYTESANTVSLQKTAIPDAAPLALPGQWAESPDLKVIVYPNGWVTATAYVFGTAKQAQQTIESIATAAAKDEGIDPDTIVWLETSGYTKCAMRSDRLCIELTFFARNIRS